MVVVNFVDGTSKEFDETSTLEKWDIDGQFAVFDMGDNAIFYYNIAFIKSIESFVDYAYE
jgi:hypothetical protein